MTCHGLNSVFNDSKFWLHLYQANYVRPLFLDQLEKLKTAPFQALKTKMGQEHRLKTLSYRKKSSFKSQFAHTDAYAFDISPDGRLVTGGTFASLILYNLQESKIIEDLPRPYATYDVQFSGPTTFVTASDSGIIDFYSLDAQDIKNPYTSLQAHYSATTRAAIFNDGRAMFTASFDQTLKLWDLSDHPTCVTTLKGWHSDWIHYCAVLTEKHLMASCGDNGTVNVFDLRNLNQPLFSQTRTLDSVTSILFDQHSNILYSTCLMATGDGSIDILDSSTFQPIQRIADPSGIQDLFCDSERLISATDTGELRVFQKKLQYQNRPYDWGVDSLTALEPCGQTLKVAENLVCYCQVFKNYFVACSLDGNFYIQEF